MKAKAIFLYLLSKPDDWDFYINNIADSCTDGKNAIQTGLKELEEFGYLLRKKKVNDKKRFIGWEYIMKLPDDTVFRQSENTTVGNNDRRNTTSYSKTDSTKTELTKTDKREGARIPELDQVKEYFASKGYNLDLATTFFNYYDEPMRDSGSKVWKDRDGRTVKSWKQKALTWMNHNKDAKIKTQRGETWNNTHKI